MKQNRVISTAVLFLLLGAAIPAFAEKGQEEKAGGGGKAQQAQPQRAQKAQPQQRAQKAQPQQRAQKAQPQQRAQKAQPQQRAQKAQPQQRAQKAQPQRTQQAQRQQPQRAQQGQRQQHPQAVASNRGGGHYGRISDDSYRSHFGRGHSFHMGRPQMIGGYNRFQYGGYWFGFNEGWPSGWDYNDDFYVEYVDGVYYMFNLRHPGFRLTLNIF
jgi:hypothetical protein